MTTQTLEGAEIFATGQHNGLEFTEADLDGIVRSFEVLDLAGRIPLKFGHEGDDARDGAPALGWVTRVWREGRKLLADFAGIPGAVFDAIQAGLYKFVSVELLRDVKAGTREIPFVLDAVALLGKTAPAVGTLKDLQSLTMRRPALQFAERVAFTRDDDGAALRAEVARLHRELVAREFDAAVREHRVLPRDRHAFEVRMGKDGTLEAAREWIAGTPKPAPLNRPGVPVRADSDDAPLTFGRPDQEVAHLTRREVEKSNGRLSYFAASTKVLRANPELAERYRHMPGDKER